MIRCILNAGLKRRERQKTKSRLKIAAFHGKPCIRTATVQAYLGHKNIQHTVRYTELAPDRFKDFWR
jgi:hypothetical protein